MEWEELKHLLIDAMTRHWECYMYTDTTVKNCVSGFIKSFSLDEDQNGTKIICQLVFISDGNILSPSPVDFSGNDCWILKVDGEMIKVYMEEINSSPSFSASSAIWLCGSIYSNDFLFKEKVIEVFDSILTRWEILDL